MDRRICDCLCGIPIGASINLIALEVMPAIKFKPFETASSFGE